MQTYNKILRGKSTLMKYLTCTTLCLLFLINDSVAQGYQWTQKADFAGGIERNNAVGFSIDGKGYVGTGFFNKKDFWEYDPSTDAWTQKADLPGVGRFSAVGFAINGKGYIGTGNNSSGSGNSPLKDFWEYDPTTDTWTQKADFGGSPRGSAVGFSIDDKGYVGTGTDAGKIDFWEYNPNLDTWTQKADFEGSPRGGAVGFSIDNKGYVGTGRDNSFSLVNDFWEYDPITDTWTRKADFKGSPRFFAMGFSIGDKGYVGTGNSTSSVGGETSDFWKYDPITDEWIEIIDFEGEVRDRTIGFSIGNKGYVGTGFHNNGPGPIEYTDFWELSKLCAVLNSSSTVEVCVGGSITINDELFDTAGDFQQELISSQGCDSTVNITINLVDFFQTEESYILCQDESITLNGELFNTAGDFQQELISSQGCDSTVNITINLVENFQTEEPYTLCQGESITINGELFDTAGDFQQDLSSIQGCDSIVNITINLVDYFQTEESYTLCQDESITINGELFDTAGNFQQDLISSQGCDSTVNITINLVDNFQAEESYTLCEDESIIINGELFDTAGSFQQDLSSLQGCDSIVYITILSTSSAYYIPNVFNPKSSNSNNLFEPFYGNVDQIFEMSIYDRWGNLVFSDKNQAWNGKFNDEFVEQGVYVYIISVDDKCIPNSVVGNITIIE